MVWFVCLFDSTSADAVFRVHPKLEYTAEAQLKKLLKSHTVEEQHLLSAEIERLRDQIKLEKQLNKREEQEMAGQVLLYGQVVQVYISINIYIYIQKRAFVFQLIFIYKII